MQIIVEISYYPLTPDYEPHILGLIRGLQAASDIEVSSGETSTVVRGEFDEVFAVLQRECRTVLQKDVKSVLVMKILNTV